jgi:two-component system, OmpR family, sensor histidine kinase MprB
VTLRTRLALLAAASAAMATIVIATVLLAVYAGGVKSRVDAALVAAAAQADDLAMSVKRQAALSAKPPASVKPLTIGDVSLELVPEGVPLGTPMAAGPVTERDAGIARREFPAGLDTRNVSGTTYRVYTMPMAGTGSGLVRASEPVATGTRSVVRFGLLLAALVVAATVMAGVLGRAIAGRALRPVTRLTRTAEAITATGDPGRRADAGLDAGRGDEVARLASSFSAMLTALQRSVEAQRQLVADASHELRTPLTSLRTDLDLLCDPPGLTDPRAPQYAERARRRTVELSDLVADLVSLARYGRRPQVMQDVRLDEVVASAAANVRDRTTPPRTLSLDLEPTLVVGDEEALYRAVVNLLDNAVAWTPAEGEIVVTLRDGQLCVSDTGPGIPAEDLPHVFERFYRSSTARSRPGSGLGLAIVKQVANQHGAALTVRSGPAGTSFTLALVPHPIDPGEPAATGAR